MQKQLSVFGNSLALVIDKPIRDLLGITRNTRLHISTDGRRIVIEPLAPEEHKPAVDRPPLAVRLDALPVFDELAHRYCMSQERFQRLSHEPKLRLMAYRGWLDYHDLDKATDAERGTMMRLQACLSELRAGKSWDDAIAAARASFPA